MRWTLAFVVLACLVRPSFAEPSTTVVVEPLYLVIGMVDATVEVEPVHHVGLAAIAGYGKPMLSASMYDLGVQANVYLQHDFTGLHVGAEARTMWGDVSLPFATDAMSMSDGRERLVGGYAGWKWHARRGFTAVAQLGVGHIDVRGPDPMSRVIPIANLNVGWSF